MIGPYQPAQAAVEIPVANAMDLVMLSFSPTAICLTLAFPYRRSGQDLLRPSGRNNYFGFQPPIT
jgi:hypothetical protein